MPQLLPVAVNGFSTIMYNWLRTGISRSIALYGPLKLLLGLLAL